MRLTICTVVAIHLVALGGAIQPVTAMADESDAADVTICSCINEPITTSAKADACTALMDSMTAEEVTEETMACQAAAAESGPDLCHCLQAINPEPSVAAACQEMIPDNLSPAELTAMITDCSSR